MFPRPMFAMLLMLLPLCASGHIARNIPCPNANDIYPCVCTVLQDNSMEMDCSNVYNEDELERIFRAEFPFPAFKRLVITGNDNLAVLREGVLGITTYEEINITLGVLQAVDDGAFSGSYSTLKHLDLTSNWISYFPFNEFGSFNHLETLKLEDNKLRIFPGISSTTISHLSLAFNPLEEISASVLQELPNLVEVHMEGCELDSISSGTFANLHLLETIYLEQNELVSLLSGAIDLTSRDNNVHLRNNSIGYIAVDALVGVKGNVYLQNNELHQLIEEVWRPLFLEDVGLYAGDNPLTCGCDIAWIVLDPNMQSKLMDEVACSTGELVVDLDPSIYYEC